MAETDRQIQAADASMAEPEPWALLLGALAPASTLFALRAGPGPHAAPGLHEAAQAAFAAAIPEPAAVRALPMGVDAVAVVVTPEAGHPLHPLHVHAALQAARRALAARLALPDETHIEAISLGVVGTDGIVRERLDALNELLETLLQRKLGVHFQPIVNLGTGQVYGYEALIRAPQAGRLKRMGHYYRAADHARVVSWLDMACLEQCLHEAARAGVRQHLFVNLDAEGMAYIQDAERSLSEQVAQVGLSPARIVVEITERQDVTDFPRLAGQIARLRDEGFKIAIDDAGEGYSTLASIADVRPDFVKVARPLVRSIENNGGRRALLEAISGFASRVGASVIAEGIETRDELATVIEIGVAFGQGYLLSKPKESFRGLRREMREYIAVQAERRRLRAGGRAGFIGTIARQGVTLPPDAPVEVARQKLARIPDLDAIVVVDQGSVVGLLTRHAVWRRMLETPALVDGP
ncbi:MAG TPA: EAL domain-containing protein, partial [Chthonomonadales bacterium]|nr:EAL domain-containing protein [Chthonomonadales bacterium]